MAPPSGKRTRYGTKQLIRQVLENPDSTNGLKTSELVSKVQGIAGKKIPAATVFQAAKSLVKGRTLSSRRDGREFRFAFASIKKSEPIEITKAQTAPEMLAAPPSDLDTRISAAQATIEGPAPASVSRSGGFKGSADEFSIGSPFPHKLDPGQMLVLAHDEKTVVTLTNVHGRPQIERHSLA